MSRLMKAKWHKDKFDFWILLVMLDAAIQIATKLAHAPKQIGSDNARARVRVRAAIIEKLECRWTVSTFPLLTNIRQRLKDMMTDFVIVLGFD